MTDVAGTTGIQTDELDETVQPGDDLYRHVNGRWIDATPIPDDKARYGSFTVLAEAAEVAVREIIERSQQAAPGTEERKVGDLYTSFTDETALEALGTGPIEPLLAEVAAVETTADVIRMVGRFERLGLPSFLQLFVDNDPGDPESYVVFLEQSGLGLPDESYYREERFADIRDKYREFVAAMFPLAGYDESADRTEHVIRLETALAGKHWDNVATRDSQKTYNKLPWSEVAALAPGIDLQLWWEAIDAPLGAFETVVVREPSFLTGLAELLQSETLSAWKDWLAWQVIRGSAPYLTSAFSATSFSFYGTALTGAPKQRERWKRGVSLVEGAMGEAVGRIYVQEHFDETSKATMDDLVAHLVEAYRQSITALDWMTDETRGRALEKLDKFTPKIGYPVRWRDYSALPVTADDLLANVRAVASFQVDRELGKIGKPIDRDEWFMTPQTINAYYNPGFNEIVFPAAILQFPFFDAGRDAAANYGAIGAVIGHEIGHGFDDQGSQYDGDGRLQNWWTEADRAAFEERTKALIAQYDALVPAEVPDNHVNGALTIGENIGDLGGLSIAWKAYLLSLDGHEPAVIDGLSGAERFFLSWAQAWRMAIRPEEAERLLTIDPHSPNEFRCNQVVRNIDVFHETFGVTEQDAMYLDPAERVAIW
ncbi:M13-type metalloendopeptidase [Curtobacterium sp. MCLR17_007]|uniref:M13 family metallopeptidase n=1 Tax=unclassified Curtobacterium TaxID=257496 RepID=UPI0006F27C84|nr:MULTISPECIES: M13-type metalloendopeptidase [unclassified Curtobacterium]KQS06207.1 peptidase M13 [Curtobacterium sp. Leaf183]WIB60334.1 M13-type metalloendopeptidase [Curtobacterium sp. MCLR17_007]